LAIMRQARPRKLRWVAAIGVPLAIVLVVLATLGVGTFAQASNGPPARALARTNNHLGSTASPPPGTKTGNHAAARADVRKLLTKLRLPAGARKVVSEPNGDNGYLRAEGAPARNATHALAHRWWEVSGTPDQVIAYIRAHPPAGGRLFETGSGGNYRSGTTDENLGYDWHAVRHVIGYRELQVTVTALKNGDTGVLAQSQVDWLPTRPASEKIPATTTTIDITSGTPRHPHKLSLAVTKPSQVRRIVRLLNKLPIAQGGFSCVLETDPLLVKMTFRTGSGSKPLAVLDYVDFRPWSGPSDNCKVVGLEIGGRTQDALRGGYFLRAIGRIVGTRLT
jgi:hypothetical protein